MIRTPDLMSEVTRFPRMMRFTVDDKKAVTVLAAEPSVEVPREELPSVI